MNYVKYTHHKTQGNTDSILSKGRGPVGCEEPWEAPARADLPRQHLCVSPACGLYVILSRSEWLLHASKDGGGAMPYFGLIVLVVMIAALVDIIGSEESGIRGLPRWGWLLLVIVLPLAGSIVWFIMGRPVAGWSGRVSGHGRASALGYPEYDEPGRFVPQDPEADAEFLRQVRARAEQQRRQAELERRRRDQENN